MRLAEIKGTIETVIKNLLKKHVVFMHYEQGDVWQDVEVEDVEEAEANGQTWLVVHYGWPNERTGDINDDWREAEFPIDSVGITKDSKNRWWLTYEAD